MSKVLIDRELAERVCHVDNSTRQTARRELRTILATPSGTPAMPVKAYYHESPNEYGGFNKSVGLEVRKAFIDAPLVLESDALTQIACLEGEIAKRDARIVELESQYQRDVYGLNNEGDPIGGDPAGGYANDNARLRAELAALKEQEPIGWYTEDHLDDKSATTYSWTVAERWVEKGWPVSPLYAAPVPVENAQVVMPERWNVPRPMWKDARQPFGNPLNHADIEAAEKFNLALDEVARLNAAPAAPAADAGIVDMYRHLQKVTPYRFKKIQDASITDGGDVMYFHKDRFDAALLADMAAHCAAKGVV